jgi:hypothetical protein
MVEYVIAKISVSLYAGAIIFKVVLGVSSQWVSAVCILVATALYTYALVPSVTGAAIVVRVSSSDPRSPLSA